MISDPTTELAGELDAGEKLLWSGRPAQGVLFRSSDLLLVPFSLLWCGFAIFWEVSVFSTNAPFFFKLWGVPFVLVGLYIVFGRFFVDSAQRAKTVYGITDQRAIIRSGIFSRTTKSLQLRTLSDITLSERSDGRGTITLGPTAGVYSWFQGTSWPGMGRHVSPSLDTIRDAKDVYDILRRAQSAV